MICASCGLDREDGSRARGIELVGVEVADVMGDDMVVCFVAVIEIERGFSVFYFFYFLHCDSKIHSSWHVGRCPSTYKNGWLSHGQTGSPSFFIQKSFFRGILPLAFIWCHSTINSSPINHYILFIYSFIHHESLHHRRRRSTLRHHILHLSLCPRRYQVHYTIQ